MKTFKNQTDKLAQTKIGFADALVAWYQENYRDLPWRNTKNPYRIWLSEIMLQQTQVNTVIPYYEKFLVLFPTVEDLARAHSDSVLKQWEGLGYYARCRNLHKTAQVIAQDYNGQFPQHIETVEQLPGIGKSTAGAILTFSFNQSHPLLDGNVKRVLSRLYNIQDDVTQSAIIKLMWEYSASLLSQTQDSYHYNQAIMELGAMVCTPKTPQCLLCPVEKFCDAKANGTQHDLPVKKAKKPIPHYTIGVGVVWNLDQKVFIQQRPEDGLLGGLWEFPGGKQEKGETLPETIAREIQEELGIQVEVGEKIIEVKHAYTHFKITLHAYHCQLTQGEPQLKAAQDGCWVPIEDLDNYAFPKANKRVLEFLTNC